MDLQLYHSGKHGLGVSTVEHESSLKPPFTTRTSGILFVPNTLEAQASSACSSHMYHKQQRVAAGCAAVSTSLHRVEPQVSCGAVDAVPAGGGAASCYPSCTTSDSASQQSTRIPLHRSTRSIV